MTETARTLGLVEALRVELGGFVRPQAVHHPGKATCDLAVMLAAGGDCPADVAMLRAIAHLFGLVASDPTISRIIDDLAGDVDTALAGVTAARAHVRAVAGGLPGGALPETGPLVVDNDATLVRSHSEKELAAPTFKRGFGFHPILAFADHGTGGTGAPLAGILRPGNAGSNTAADHITVTDLALAQLDPGQRARVLVRTDSAGGTTAARRAEHIPVNQSSRRRCALRQLRSESTVCGTRAASEPRADADGAVDEAECGTDAS